jgi:hypothetical protein
MLYRRLKDYEKPAPYSSRWPDQSLYIWVKPLDHRPFRLLELTVDDVEKFLREDAANSFGITDPSRVELFVCEMMKRCGDRREMIKQSPDSIPQLYEIEFQKWGEAILKQDGLLSV